MVPAQVQFLHVTHLLNALWYCGDLLQTEVQTTSFIKRQFYAVQGHFQCDGFAFTLLPLVVRTHDGKKNRHIVLIVKRGQDTSRSYTRTDARLLPFIMLSKILHINKLVYI